MLSSCSLPVPAWGSGCSPARTPFAATIVCAADIPAAVFLSLAHRGTRASSDAARHLLHRSRRVQRGTRPGPTLRVRQPTLPRRAAGPRPLRRRARHHELRPDVDVSGQRAQPRLPATAHPARPRGPIGSRADRPTGPERRGSPAIEGEGIHLLPPPLVVVGHEDQPAGRRERADVFHRGRGSEARDRAAGVPGRISGEVLLRSGRVHASALPVRQAGRTRRCCRAEVRLRAHPVPPRTLRLRPRGWLGGPNGAGHHARGRGLHPSAPVRELQGLGAGGPAALPSPGPTAGHHHPVRRGLALGEPGGNQLAG